MELADADGPVTFYPLPYISPLMLKEHEEDLPTGDFDEALGRVLAGVPQLPGRGVCLAHCFTVGGRACESERPLSVQSLSAVQSMVEASCVSISRSISELLLALKR